MHIHVYQVMHVLAGFLLTAVTFQAFAAPTPERRKRTLMWSGILSILMLVGGFGLAAKLGLNIAKTPWLHVKILCWLVLSAMAGVAFRAPSLGRVLSLITTLIVALAIYMVYAGRPGV
ncbi:MAG: SirB2 family protein [Planctomycetota bacterium]